MQRFVVPTRELPTKKRWDVDASYVEELLTGHPLREALGEDAPPAGEGHLEVELYQDGTHVFVSGRMTGWVEVACSRCVGPARLLIDEPVRITFVPQHELVGKADEVAAVPSAKDESTDSEELGPEVEEGDLDLFGYDGEQVDLEPLVREQFVLAIPYAPLCAEDCKGLCGQCGTDLIKTAACVPPSSMHGGRPLAK